MDSLTNLKSQLPLIQEKLGFSFANPDLLILAFTHRSFINEYRISTLEHNERLEFLGDSVLGLIIADFLYHRLPGHPEGQLSQIRSHLVEASSCARYLQKLDLVPFILLGKGERLGAARPSILADVFEALLGALYLDSGLKTVRDFLLLHFETEIEEAIGSPHRNYKAELQDLSQKKFQKPPQYKVIEETGPDHAKIFHVLVFLNDQEMGLGIGASKKEAEAKAALDALSKFGVA